MQSEKTFKFLDLPPELRNMIYVYFFRAKPHKAYGYPKNDRLPGLLLANKQIHKEAIELFYSITTFQIGGKIDEWIKFLPIKRLDTINYIRNEAKIYISHCGICFGWLHQPRLREGVIWMPVREFGEPRTLWKNGLGEKEGFDGVPSEIWLH